MTDDFPGFAAGADGRLHAEAVPLEDIAARFGTPCYVYSRHALESAYRSFSDACTGRDVLVCYAMKANSNLAILDLFARLGAGFDIVSGGELARVIAAGGDPGKVVFSGVGKTAEEMRAALSAGIRCFNVESGAELDRLERVAASLGRRAPVSFRVNPDVDAGTHPYISTGLRENKFGVPLEEAGALYRRAGASPHLRVSGIDVHIGSQITEVAPFVDALERTLELVDMLDAASLRRFDFKIRFGYLRREQRRAMLARVCGESANEVAMATAVSAIDRLEQLTPGDFANVLRQLHATGEAVEPARVLHLLAAEVAIKPEARHRGIGFTSAQHARAQ